MAQSVAAKDGAKTALITGVTGQDGALLALCYTQHSTKSRPRFLIFVWEAAWR